jgi:hypothetical protein
MFTVWMEEDQRTLRVARAENGVTLVASLNLIVGDWAVYMGQGEDAAEIGRTGDKIGSEAAAVAFPQFAKGFRYRP